MLHENEWKMLHDNEWKMLYDNEWKMLHDIHDMTYSSGQLKHFQNHIIGQGKRLK